jgi:chromosome segregation ATPase
LKSLEVEIRETHDRLEKAEEQDTQLQIQLDLVKIQLAECQSELANGMKELGEKTRSLESTQNNLVVCQETLHEQRERSASLEQMIEQQEANLIGVQSECNLLKEAVIRAEVRFFSNVKNATHFWHSN